MPSIARRSSSLGPTPSSLAMGSWSRKRRVRATAPDYVLFDAQEVRIQRLAAMVDLAAHLRPVLAQPLRDPPGLGRRRPLTLDDRHDLMVVTDDGVEESARGFAQFGGDGHDAVAGQPD